MKPEGDSYSIFHYTNRIQNQMIGSGHIKMFPALALSLKALFPYNQNLTYQLRFLTTGKFQFSLVCQRDNLLSTALE